MVGRLKVAGCTMGDEVVGRLLRYFTLRESRLRHKL